MKRSHYKQFEDLIIWKEGVNPACDIYRLFRNSKEYAIRDQIIRSSISIPSNIAEGFERQSDKEFVRFLYYSKGSSGELRTQLYIANQLCLIDETECAEAITRSRRISGMIQNLITTIKKDIHQNE
jgi:four helix bundle protein